MKYTLLLLLQSVVYGATFTHPSFSFEYNDKIWDIVPTAKTQGADKLDSQMQGKTLATLQRKNADEKYKARFSIVIDSLEKMKPKKGESLTSAYTRFSQDFLKSQRFTILDSKKIAVGNPALEGTDSTLYQRDFGLKFRQIILIRQDQAYLLTFTSRMKPFDDYVKDIDALVGTLRFTDKQTS